MFGRVKWNKNYLGTILFIVVLSMISNITVINATNFDEEQDEKLVLYINSYHQGYKWSDDIEETIRAKFATVRRNIEVESVYLDTQRISDTNPTKYYEALSKAIEVQFAGREIDLIMTSDDAAFEFVEKYLGFIDAGIPMLFCGINELEKIQYDIGRDMGGIVEFLDIKSTIDLITQLHPSVENIYYISDATLTGANIEKELLKQSEELLGDLNLIKLDGENLASIEDKVKNLGKDSAILYTIYFYDNEDKYYEYDHAIQSISEVSPVPIYGLWEFTLGHGIVGGKLLSGIEQGETIAEQALSYFENENYEFTSIIDNNNTLEFDYEQLLKFDIVIDDLPDEVDIVNYSTIPKKNVLVIHSYSQGFQWTDRMMDGITESLREYSDNYEIYTEYMDLKRIDTPVYIYEYNELFTIKNKMIDYDLIITTDDGAFGFAKAYATNRGNDIPIVFCGVNYLDEKEITEHQNYSGVMEFYDLDKTFELIVKLQPEVTRLLVINDTTVTGRANSKNVDLVKGKFSELDIFQVNDLTMTEIVELVSEQNNQTAILLMSFNRDRANNNFSYSESIDIIEDASNVPIYSVWDFYLGDGVVGGYMTNGYEQGLLAGEIGVKILNGEDVSSIDIITESPNTYMVDMDQIEKFNINKVNIPKDAVIINEDNTFIDLYVKYKNVFDIALIILIVVIVLIVVLSYFLRNSIKMNKRITRLANFDQLTSILNRREGIKQLKTFVTNGGNQSKHISIAFIDINDLKGVNDQYGHSEGDDYIIKVVELINNRLNEGDIFCRMGGDEFMAVIKNSEYGELEFSALVKKDMDQFNETSKKKYTYGVSIGVYSFSVNPKIDVNKVIEAADTLMYSDKAQYKL